MAVISIKIDVLNPKELIGKKKGKALKVLASIFMNEKSLKKKVEEQVVSEVLKKIQENLESGLKAEGVRANLRYTVNLESDQEKV